MKKTIILLGVIGALVTSIGIFCKLMHWAGASVAVTIGVLALFIYSLLFMIEELKIASSGLSKLFVALFGISGALMSIAFLFKLLHWPGAGVLIYCFFASYLLLIIVAFFKAFLEKDKEQQFKYYNHFVWLLGLLMLAYPTIFRFLLKN